MGRLLLTENGVQYWRNFKYMRVIKPDGRMSRELELSGTVILTTGNDERTLEFLHPAHGVTKRRSLREIVGDIATLLVVLWLLRAVLLAL